MLLCFFLCLPVVEPSCFSLGLLFIAEAKLIMQYPIVNLEGFETFLASPHSSPSLSPSFPFWMVFGFIFPKIKLRAQVPVLSLV